MKLNFDSYRKMRNVLIRWKKGIKSPEDIIAGVKIEVKPDSPVRKQSLIQQEREERLRKLLSSQVIPVSAKWHGKKHLFAVVENGTIIVNEYFHDSDYIEEVMRFDQDVSPDGKYRVTDVIGERYKRLVTGR